MAAHDCEAILHMEELLLKQDQSQKKQSQFYAEHRFYITRLRIAQIKETIGLCIKTKQFSNLMNMIERDDGAAKAFGRLHKLNVEGPKVNEDMRQVRDIRNNTFHYSLDESPDLYASTIADMLARGERFCEIAQERRSPDRFELADRLFQNMFFRQLLNIDLSNPEDTGDRMAKTAQFLAQAGDDISNVARSISQGLLNKYRDKTA